MQSQSSPMRPKRGGRALKVGLRMARTDGAERVPLRLLCAAAALGRTDLTGSGLPSLTGTVAARMSSGASADAAAHAHYGRLGTGPSDVIFTVVGRG